MNAIPSTGFRSVSPHLTPPVKPQMQHLFETSPSPADSLLVEKIMARRGRSSEAVSAASESLGKDGWVTRDQATAVANTASTRKPKVGRTAVVLLAGQEASQRHMPTPEMEEAPNDSVLGANRLPNSAAGLHAERALVREALMLVGVTKVLFHHLAGSFCSIDAFAGGTLVILGPLRAGLDAVAIAQMDANPTGPGGWRAGSGTLEWLVTGDITLSSVDHPRVTQALLHERVEAEAGDVERPRRLDTYSQRVAQSSNLESAWFERDGAEESERLRA